MRTSLLASSSVRSANATRSSIHQKLIAGDCSWGTMKLVLGWIIDMEAMTIGLPQHRIDHLESILSAFPRSQQRTSVKRWHETLGELRSMSLALPGARNIFSSMQSALSTQSKNRITLNKGVHDALDNFRWMHKNIALRPTRMAEVVPLPPIVEGPGSRTPTSPPEVISHRPSISYGVSNGRNPSHPNSSPTPILGEPSTTPTLNSLADSFTSTPLPHASTFGNGQFYPRGTT
jgi:hypothetical protein